MSPEEIAASAIPYRFNECETGKIIKDKARQQTADRIREYAEAYAAKLIAKRDINLKGQYEY